MKSKALRITFFLLAIITVFLIFMLIRNQIVDIIKFAKVNDRQGMKDVITNHGVWGVLLIVVVEAIQMIVVFIPAEFIQIAAGISYPWYFAILFCLVGIFCGATIIYVLVNVLNLNRTIFYKSSKKLDDMVSRKKANVTTQTLMYLLFFMPIIPFGAICYFGSSTKMSYRRYIITCVTGVIPSILSSIVVGNVVINSIGNGNTWIWALVIVILAAIVLFAVLTLILKKKFFVKETNKYRPNGIVYNILYYIFSMFLNLKYRPKINREGLEDVQGPALFLMNHASYWDFILAAKVISPHRVTVVTNRYYFRNKRYKFLFDRLAVIPKRLFYPDLQTTKSILGASKANRYIVMFPEGRLSTDGTNFNIVEGAGALLKKMQAQLVIMNIHGNYMAKPKWAKKSRRGIVEIGVKKKISSEEIQNLSIEEIEKIINENIVYNDFEYAREHNLKYRGSKFAEGLEGILYYCPHCHKEFTMKTKKSIISCSHCGFAVTLNNNYQFSDNVHNIHDIAQWNKLQKKYENNNLQNEDYKLETLVKVKKLDPVNAQLDEYGEGVCILTKEQFTFNGMVNNNGVTFNIPTIKLKALPFSANEEFECYYDNILYYFYPIENPQICAKWSLTQDLIYQMVKDNE